MKDPIVREYQLKMVIYLGAVGAIVFALGIYINTHPQVFAQFGTRMHELGMAAVRNIRN